MPATLDGTILCLDVGTKRVGVAIASYGARLPQPLTTLSNDEHFFTALKQLFTDESVRVVVVGMPRGLEGQVTDQTRLVEEFVTELKSQTTLPLYMQDEALTSRKAEAELDARGTHYSKADVDALAASYILDDYLQGQGAGK